MYVVFNGTPTEMYLRALGDLVKSGDELAPRGKRIKEIRPATFEFTNPYNRVTFLKNRRINAFFQIAESLWILSGRADVEWLTKFNSNMGQFSDDGKYFNAPYGERMRSWNKNALHNIIINPIDQLADAYLKLLDDKDTRQAVIVLSNPMFDNSNYTIKEHGRDIACNLVFTFKIRNNQLHMTVFNRSNDIHWGLFGANLCQFSTIQEVLLNWLKYSGKSEFEELEMGTYTHITDSLHVYLDDYGAKITEDILNDNQIEGSQNFVCDTDPFMSLNQEKFSTFLTTYWGVIDPYLTDDEFMLDDSNRNSVFGSNGLLFDLYDKDTIDDYWYFGIQAMAAYRLVKLRHLDKGLKLMEQMVSCEWKVSMLYFLKEFIRKAKDTVDTETYKRIVSTYQNQVEKLPYRLLYRNQINHLLDYLKLDC